MAKGDRRRFMASMLAAVDAWPELAGCPLCAKGSVKFVYYGHAVTRIGYLWSWCDACLRGVSISRAAAPEHVPLVPFGSESGAGAPRYAEIKR
ncbi:hypothetical protein [Longispora albida]|uniref:hypothetical protein n=1 Tax=Longispora albida TaxID=203523 RepID=UPI00058EF5CC|nr:hypothetical protein [Longispora albida]